MWTDSRTSYMQLVESALANLIPVLKKLDPPVTYHTYFSTLGGKPDMSIWYAFADRASKERAVASGLDSQIREMTRNALLGRGYPAQASLLLTFTSYEEIQVRRGYFGLFGAPEAKRPPDEDENRQ